MFPAGTRLGPYEIVTPIGSGGMGDVYRARDTRLERDVAVKVLPDRVSRDAEARLRFESEAKAVAALNHPNILSIHDYGEHEQIAYSVTELLEGETLRQRLRQGALSWRKTVEIGAALADGLAAAHARGIIHRDLKPENVFLTNDGRVKILDFGIAVLSGSQAARDDEEDPSSVPTAPMSLTNPSTVTGTTGYLSPEQLRGERAEATSDIFSLGTVLYEMVVGKAAFIRSTPIESLSAILTDAPDPFTDSRKMIPVELARLITRCLEKRASERFQSARDLAFALRAIGTASSLSFELPSVRRKRLWMIGGVALLLLAIAGAVMLYSNREERAVPAVAAPRVIRSLAILPFVNATGDPGAEYFSDGMTETLINTMSQVPGLKVMSRTSVFQYKGQDRAPVKIARDLGVGAVVVGRFAAVGDQIVVSVELVDAADRSQMWGNRYQAPRGDIFTIQQSIANEIARALQLQLTAPAQQLLSKRHTDNAAAYELYLKGRFQWNKRSAEGLYKAIEFFNQAIEIDPEYALAYAGVADCYNLLDIWAGLPTKETFPKAKAAAQKALSIDDQLAEAHTSLAYAIHNYEWDAASAEREYQRALQLNGNYATAHQWYAEFLTANGRFDDAAREGRKALELDPMSPIINAVVGWNEAMARRYAEAIEQNTRTTQLFPKFMPGHAYLGLAYLESGRGRDAVPPLEQARALLDIVVIQTWLARAHHVAGQTAQRDAIVRELERRGRREYLPPYYMATLYAQLGDHDRAFRYLEQAYRERTGAMVWVKVDPALDPLRADARFAAFKVW